MDIPFYVTHHTTSHCRFSVDQTEALWKSEENTEPKCKIKFAGFKQGR